MNAAINGITLQSLAKDGDKTAISARISEMDSQFELSKEAIEREGRLLESPS